MLLALLGAAAVGAGLNSGSGEETYECNLCHNYRGSREQVTNHVVNNHERYKCVVKECTFATYDVREFKLHIMEEKIDFLIACELIRKLEQSK